MESSKLKMMHSMKKHQWGSFPIFKSMNLETDMKSICTFMDLKRIKEFQSDNLYVHKDCISNVVD